MINKTTLTSSMLKLVRMFSGSRAVKLLVPPSLRRPTGKELRNPADLQQAARIQAAADKRTRKGAKLTSNHKTK